MAILVTDAIAFEACALVADHFVFAHMRTQVGLDALHAFVYVAGLLVAEVTAIVLAVAQLVLRDTGTTSYIKCMVNLAAYFVWLYLMY